MTVRRRHDDGRPRARDRPLRRSLRTLLAGIVVLGVSGCGTNGTNGTNGPNGPNGTLAVEMPGEKADATRRYVIPSGAKAAQERGETLEILPSRLRLKVGDVIEIVNDDVASHLVGPFYVRAGETLRQRFASAGEFVGECSVHPSGQLAIVVT